MNTTTPAPGTYSVFNPHSYTTQVLRVTAQGAEVYAAASGVYPAAFLRRASLEEVAAVLAHPRTVLYSFTPAPVPTIGKARAAKLHRLMGRAGIPSGEHYSFAGAALNLPVYSLAALTEDQARQVWRFLCALFPQARAA
ncbi:hypothetical protein [Deinococcus sp. YIM 77859]|uniref:hypothetical protein n=1 Tax=Deinococcus sp. YIM 77859 TaxID=1540221 RepID=UPI000A4455F8|nr:hypothetical protein [Deinococcus sp. YIM 77859]